MIIRAEHLTKHFGHVIALDSLDLEIEEELPSLWDPTVGERARS